VVAGAAGVTVSPDDLVRIIDAVCPRAVKGRGIVEGVEDGPGIFEGVEDWHDGSLSLGGVWRPLVALIPF